MPDISVSEAAQDYLADLLDKQDAEGMGVRMFVTQPGTPYAETCLAYSRAEERVETDEHMDFPKFTLYVDKTSVPFLAEAVVDFSKDRMGGQLTIKAPNSKMPKITDDSPLSDKVTYILYTEINPGLAHHGGEVSLVEIVDENVAVLRFGGGCQGCSAVDITLKDGVERTLMEKIPELSSVRDITDHSYTENAYFR